jgi:CRP/FNR family transcriptional regulator, cyclic AMP receptor protein
MGVFFPQLTSLSAFPVFQGLIADEIVQVTKIVRPISVPRRTTIIRAGEPGNAAYLILSGTLKVHADQSDGSNVILGIHGPGQLVGEMSLLERRECSATVATLEQSTLWSIDHSALETCLQTIPLLTYNLSRHLSRRLRAAAAHIQACATLDIASRVARQLLAFAQECGKAASNGGILIPLRLTQSDLADMIGASRMRVNRVLCGYKAQRYLSLCPDGRIILHQPEVLARQCQSDLLLNTDSPNAFKV